MLLCILVAHLFLLLNIIFLYKLYGYGTVYALLYGLFQLLAIMDKNVRNILTQFFKKIYLVFDGGGQREKERERNTNVWLPLVCPLLGTWPATQACALTGNGTCNPLVRRPALDPLNQPHQPG